MAGGGLVPLAVSCPLSVDICLGKKRKRSSDLVQETEEGGRRFLKYVFIKRHGGKNKEDTPSPILFVANIGSKWSEDDTRSVFSIFGKVDNVEIGVSNNCRFARVTYLKNKAVKRALASAEKQESIMFPIKAKDDDSKPSWIAAYEQQHPGLLALKKESEDYLARFAELEKLEEERRQQAAKTDADGFTLVTYKKGARSQAKPSSQLVDTMTENGERKYITTTTGSSRKLAEKKKKDEKKFEYFYQFQRKEKKRGELAELRDKYEQDKQRIQRMKDSRKFKPF